MDNSLNPNDFPLGTADHDAVVLGVSHQGGGSTRRFRGSFDLFQVELLDQGSEFRRVAVVQLDIAKLSADGRRGGGVQLLDQSSDALNIDVGGQHDDLLS